MDDNKKSEDNVAKLVSNMIEITDYFCKPTEQFLSDDSGVSHMASVLTDSIINSMLISSGNKCTLQIVKYLRNMYRCALDFSEEGTLLQLIRDCNEDELLHLCELVTVKVPGLSDNEMFQKALLHAFEGTHMMWTAISNILKYGRDSSMKKFIFSKIRETKENSLPPVSIMEDIIRQEPSLLTGTVSALFAHVLTDKHTNFKEYMNRSETGFLISWSSRSLFISQTVCNILYDYALTAANNRKLSAFIGYLFQCVLSLENSNIHSSKYEDLVFYLTIDPSFFPVDESAEHLIFGKCFVLKLLISSLFENPQEIVPLIVCHRKWYKELSSFSLKHKLCVFERLFLNTSLFTLNA